MKLVLPAALALFVLPSPALSQSTQSPVEKRYSATFNGCMASGDAAQGITTGILDCYSPEITAQDARLNQAYKMVMARLNAARKATLRNSERAWIRTRDAQCSKAMDQYEGGSMGRIALASCMLDETIKRTIWLERYR